MTDRFCPGRADYWPQAPPQPNLPAVGQVGLVRQVSQARVAGVGTRATKDDSPLVSLAAPQEGHCLATSFWLRAR